MALYYDFQNMNYGSEELNQYAKTLPTSFFVTAHLNSQLRPSYTNSTDVRFSLITPIMLPILYGIMQRVIADISR